LTGSGTVLSTGSTAGAGDSTGAGVSVAAASAAGGAASGISSATAGVVPNSVSTASGRAIQGARLRAREGSVTRDLSEGEWMSRRDSRGG
jgi:hypothetical protein